MASIKYNIGTLIKGSDHLNVFSATTGTDTKKNILVTIAADGTFDYVSRSAMQTNLALQKATIASVVDLQQFEDVPPAGVESGKVTIDNGSALSSSRLFTGQALFSLRGSNVDAYTGEAGTVISGSNAKTAISITQASAKTISELATEATAWAAKNPLLLAAIAFLALELFGVTNFLGISLKKKKRSKRR